MSRRRFGCQTGKKLRRTGTTKIRVFRELPETTLQQFQGLSNTKQELFTQSTQLNNDQSDSRCLPKQSKKDSVRQRQMSTTSRATPRVEQNKASSNYNGRWRQVMNEQRDSMTTIDYTLFVVAGDG